MLFRSFPLSGGHCGARHLLVPRPFAPWLGSCLEASQVRSSFPAWNLPPGLALASGQQVCWKGHCASAGYRPRGPCVPSLLGLCHTMCDILLASQKNERHVAQSPPSLVTSASSQPTADPQPQTGPAALLDHARLREPRRPTQAASYLASKRLLL